MSGTERQQRRLTPPEIDVLLSLIARGAALLPTTLRSDQRPVIVPMWRRQLIELWFRRPPAEHAPMQGPFYRLTASGAQLAFAIHDKRKLFKNPAPRGLSGAE